VGFGSPRRLPGLLVVLLFGCAEDVTELRAFLGGTMVLTHSPEPRQSHVLMIDLYGPDGSMGCPPAMPSDTRASINGVPLVVHSRGGHSSSGLSCKHPRFLYDDIERGNGPSATLAITDGLTQWEVVMPELLHPRQFRLAVPEDGVVGQAGDAVIEHSVQSDRLVNYGPGKGPEISIHGRPFGTSYGRVQSVVDGHRIRFKLPVISQTTPPSTGVSLYFFLERQPFVLRFEPSQARAPTIKIGDGFMSVDAQLLPP
jgi:hypothetical protein